MYYLQVALQLLTQTITVHLPKCKHYHKKNKGAGIWKHNDLQFLTWVAHHPDLKIYFWYLFVTGFKICNALSSSTMKNLHQMNCSDTRWQIITTFPKDGKELLALPVMPKSWKLILKHATNLVGHHDRKWMSFNELENNPDHAKKWAVFKNTYL